MYEGEIEVNRKEIEPFVSKQRRQFEKSYEEN